MPDRNIHIYTADAALQAEDSLLGTKDAFVDAMMSKKVYTKTSLEDFCAFIDFYTRKTADPFSTSLACEKQAEAVELSATEATPENLRLLLDTMLEAIDHLEKKWLDEQLKHEERQRQHREDVAALYAQLRAFQPEMRNLSVYRRSMQAIQGLFLRGKVRTPDRKAIPQSRKVVTSKHKHGLAHA